MFLQIPYRYTATLFLYILAIVSVRVNAYGQADKFEDRTFQIMKLNTPSISIGGVNLKQGQTFKGSKSINWADDNQLMEVKDVSDGHLYKFSKKVMDSKGTALSLSDFFLRTNKASSRDVDKSGYNFRKSPYASRFPERRLALVMGNSNYFNLSYLKNAQKDASDIADMLLTLGFDVLEAYETNYDDMRTVLNKFSGMGRDYDAVLFYFAGHGLQDDGKNYLIPINAELEFRSELRTMLQGDDVLQRVAATGAPTQFIFIDACRNAKNSWSRDITEGLARMEGGPGAVIVFSTESGKVALDGEGDNSPFASALLRNLSTPSGSFSETMNGVVRETYQSTGQKQYPLIVGTPLTDFNFNPGKSGSVASSTTSRPAQSTTVTSQSKPKQTNILVEPTTNQNSTKESAELVSKAKQLIKRFKADQAAPYLRQAAEMGNVEAYYLLGDLYYTGNGVTKSFSTARKYFEIAANSGYVNAEYMMGVTSRNGQGCEKNFNEARRWLQKAASQGHEKARNMLDKL